MSPRLGHFNKEKSGKWAFFHSMQEATFSKIAWYSLRVVQNPNRLDQNTPKKPCTKWTGCKRYSTPHQGKETVIMTASPTGRQHRKEVKIAPYLTPQGKNSWIKCKTQNFLTLKKKMITYWVCLCVCIICLQYHFSNNSPLRWKHGNHPKL